MSKISLHFFGREQAELGEVIFSHPLLEKESRVVRGKSHGAHIGCGSFPWGSVAKGLSLLLLRAKAHGVESGVLEGEAASEASSLDYAISKPPVWLEELLGSDRRGESLARRVFKRTNPERKRPGPVTLSVNPHQLRTEDIHIRWDGHEVLDNIAIQSLLGNLEQNLTRRPTVSVQSESRAEETSAIDSSPHRLEFDFTGKLENEYLREVTHSLSRPNIFTARGLQTQITSLKNNPSFNRLISKPAHFLNSLAGDSASSIRFGCCDQRFLDRNLKSDKPLQIWVTAVQPANYALVKYLKDIKGYNLEIEYRFNYGVELAHNTVDPRWGEGPDFCFAGVGPAIHIYNNAKGRYHPWLLAPTLSHAIVAHRDADSAALGRGEYHFVVDEPTTASFCFDHLTRDGTLNENGLSLHHSEPEDIMALLGTADNSFRSLLWFPHYELYRILYGAQVFYSNEHDAFNQCTIGFVHQRVKRRPAQFLAFQVALRDAWLSMRENPLLIQELVSGITRDKEYTKFVARACGLHHAPLAA